MADALDRSEAQRMIEEESGDLRVLIHQAQEELSHHHSGTGTPEGALAAPVGDVYRDTAGGVGTTLYIKESGGTGNTGWTAK